MQCAYYQIDLLNQLLSGRGHCFQGCDIMDGFGHALHLSVGLQIELLESFELEQALVTAIHQGRS